MATIVNMHQAKASLSRLVERALAGEEVVIARNGEPLIQFMRVPKKAEAETAPAVPGRRKGKIFVARDAGFADGEITERVESPTVPEPEK
jgi:antitoxin (DNA-binding transcriptional repressor) of toxin-antitoxin stability system